MFQMGGYPFSAAKKGLEHSTECPPPNSKAPFKVIYSLENKVVRTDSFLKLPHLLP